MSKFRFTVTRHVTEKDQFERGEVPTAEAFLRRLLKRGHQEGIKDGSGLIGATFAPGGRLEGKYVETVTALILDVDGKHKKNGVVYHTYIDPDSVIDLLRWRGVAHTSFSHTPEYPSFRVILPLAEELSVPEFRRLWFWMHEATNKRMDPSCKNPDRMYFLPRRPFGSDASAHWIRELPGPLLSIKDVPADFVAPQEEYGGGRARKHKGLHVAPPTTKYGAVDTHELLEKLLDLPIYQWALEEAGELSRECWRGLATNIAAVVLEDEAAWDAGSEAFHAISEPDEDRYSYNATERTFRDALNSARDYGPMTYANLVLNGAPEETAPGESVAKAPVVHARRNLKKEPPTPKAPPSVAPEAATTTEAPASTTLPAVKQEDEEPELTAPTSDDFLFDVSEAKWIRRMANGEWSEPFTTAAMNQILLHAGVGKKWQDGFLADVKLIDKKEPLYDTTDIYVVRRGVRIFNTYRPPELKPKAGDWSDYKALLLHLAGGDPAALDFILDWMAAPLQSLHRTGQPRMMGTAVVFHGSQGAGKGITTNLFRLLYGGTNVCVIGQEGLDGRFNGALENKLMLIANEVMSSSNRSMETANKIKPWITDPWVSLERKHKDAEEVKNNMNCLFTSNDERPVIIEATDRRFSVFRSTALDPALGQRLDDDQKGPQTKTAAFFDHLLNRKTTISFGHRYETKERLEIINESQGAEESFVRALADLGWMGLSAGWEEDPRNKDRDGASRAVVEDGDVVLSDTLTDVFSYFCTKKGFRRARISSKMGRLFREHFPGVKNERVSVGGKQRRAWLNLPMQPLDAPPPEPVKPNPYILTQPVQQPVKFNTMIDGVDDGDF